MDHDADLAQSPVSASPVEPESLRPFLPPAVDLDTFDGQAWLGVVAFRLSKIRLRGLPEVRLISHFNEVNLTDLCHSAGHPGCAISEHGCPQPARDYAGSPPVRTSLHARGHDIRPHASRPPVQQRPYFRAQARAHNSRPNTTLEAQSAHSAAAHSSIGLPSATVTTATRGVTRIDATYFTGHGHCSALMQLLRAIH